MRDVYLVLARPKGRAQLVVQSVGFRSSEWTHAEASRWLARNGFKVRNFDRVGNLLRARQREVSEFDPRSFRTVVTHGGEEIHVNKRKKRRTTKRRRTAKHRSHQRTRSRKGRARRAVKRSSRRHSKRKVKRSRARKASARRYTVVFSSREQARALIDSMRSSATRRAWRRALRHYGGGRAVYIALPTWRGSAAATGKAAAAIRLRLAYEAGRRRRRFGGSLPRVAIAPK